MSPDEASHGSIAIGGFSLQVGGAGGVVVQQSNAPAAEGTGTLAQALEEPHPKNEGAAVAAAESVEGASDVTAKCERAVSLSKGVAEGKAFSSDQLSAEVGVLLDLLERLDRKGRHKDQLRVARALVTLLMLLRRWAALLQMLRTALRTAEEIGDLDAVAWAKHEIGSLRLVAGDVKGAERDLREAREIRERIGDRSGLRATNHNLGTLCERLRQMLREEELVRRSRSRGPRPMVLRVLALAALFALAFGAGVLAANSGSGRQAGFEKGGPTAHHGNPGGDGNDGNGDGGNPGGNGNDGGTPDSYRLAITFTGKGHGVVFDDEGVLCTSTCVKEFRAGLEVTLDAEAVESSFEGFSGDCTRGDGTCTVTMSADRSVTVAFSPEEEEEEETTEEEPPEEFKEGETETEKEPEVIP